MKKVLLFISIITLSVITTNAQVAFGIKGGLNVSSVSNLANNFAAIGSSSASNKSKLKLGGQFGIYANIKFGDVLGLQPEVLFSMKGYKYVSESKSSSFEAKRTDNVNLNYVEIPLQLRINPVKSFYILVGPYLGILAGASTVSTSYSSAPPNAPVTTETKSSSTNGLRSIDFGIAAGLGLKTENGFTMGLKYSRGFVSIVENDNNSPNVNSVFQLFVGFEFGGK